MNGIYIHEAMAWKTSMQEEATKRDSELLISE
jgi:hypothetical protein